MTNVFHEIDDKKIESILQKKALTRCIDDKKWVELIGILIANFQKVRACKVKLLWEDEETFRRLLFDEFTSYNFDYYDSAMEAMISGEPKGWYAYREIEWLDFPRKGIDGVNSNTKTSEEQNLELIQKIIDKIGLKTILKKDNLRLYAYQKIQTMET